MTKNSANKLCIINSLFEVTNIVKRSDEEKYVYSGYEIAFDGKGSWSFNDDFARNVIIFGVDSSLSSHTDNLKDDFLVLVEGDTFSSDGSFDAVEKNLLLILVKQKQSFAWVCIIFTYL